ncbi:MAG: exo-alpha-sialidase [Thaumarchaeota archaeon]|nr:exo-alpha-sialidase [Nitrososphaerota archaeon]
MKILLFSIIAIIAISAFASSPQVFAQDMGGPVRISPYQLSQLVASGKNVYVTYQQNSYSGNTISYFTKSSDGGKSFRSPIGLGSAVEPVVSSYGNNVYLAWETGFTGWPPSHVMFAKSNDGGDTFGTPILLDNNTNSSSVITQLLPDGKRLFAVIVELGERPPYNSGTYLISSRDNGTMWGKKVELLPTAVMENPLGYGTTIQEVMGKIVVASMKKVTCENPNYCQYVIFLRSSADMGSTFGPEIDIARSWNPVRLQVTSSGNNIYAVWIDGTRGEGPSLYFSKSNDGGENFSKPVIIGQEEGEYDWPHMVAVGNTVHVIWQYNNENLIAHARYNGVIPPAFVSGFFYAKSTDGGNTFSHPVNLNGDVGTSYFSELSVEEGNVYVGWTSIHGSYEQEFFARSTDGGNTFSNPVTPTGGTNAGVSQIASSGSYVYLAGMAASGNIVWLKASSDHGADFDPLMNLNGGKGETEVSSLTFLCCVADQPWFQNGWLWTAVAISVVIGSWFFLFRRLKER